MGKIIDRVRERQRAVDRRRIAAGGLSREDEAWFNDPSNFDGSSYRHTVIGQQVEEALRASLAHKQPGTVIRMSNPSTSGKSWLWDFWRNR
jgi:hypothetical protein